MSTVNVKAPLRYDILYGVGTVRPAMSVQFHPDAFSIVMDPLNMETEDRCLTFMQAPGEPAQQCMKRDNHEGECKF